jgi:hypothetical protein
MKNESHAWIRAIAAYKFSKDPDKASEQLAMLVRAFKAWANNYICYCKSQPDSQHYGTDKHTVDLHEPVDLATYRSSSGCRTP